MIQFKIDEDYLRQLAQEELKKIISENNVGTWWDLKRLEQETCRKRDWLMDNVVFNPVYREQIKLISCKSGNGWLFNGHEMKKFLEDNFIELTKGVKR